MTESQVANPPIPTKESRLHVHPDYDAVNEYHLAFRRPQFFPGIETAPLKYVPQGEPPEGRSALELQKEGIVCFDTGKGPLDHHPQDEDPEHCGSDKVADYVGISNSVIYEDRLAYARMHDLQGPMALSLALRENGCSQELIDMARLHEKFSFSNLPSIFRRIYGNDNDMIRMMFALFDVVDSNNLRFWTTVQEEFKAKATIMLIRGPWRRYKVAFIDSPVYEVGSFSRTEEGGFCTVCVHRNPTTGYVSVSGHLASEQNFDLGGALRVYEMQQEGINNEPYTNAQLHASDMKINDKTVWFLPVNYKRECYVVINGGLKAVSARPTKLGFEAIYQTLALTLEEKFHPNCPGTSCLFNNCPHYGFFLSRCRGLRESTRS